MIKARDELNTVLGGPGSRLDDYNYLGSFLINKRSKLRKDKIKKIFNADRKEK